MRKLLIVFFIVIVAMSILWVLAGRQMAAFLDQFGTRLTALTPTSYVAYQGTGDGGTVTIGAKQLSLAPLNPHVGSNKNNELAIASGGKVFSIGPLQSSEGDKLEADSLDNSPSFRQEGSYLAWPSFGPTPHLQRNQYYEYVLTARSGQRLRMVWSVDAEANATSLIRVEISDAAR
jgi:hypothetical protein